MSATPSLEVLFHQLSETMKKASAELNQEALSTWVTRCQEIAHYFQQGDESAYQQGQDLTCQLISYWPQLTPVIPRDLLWLLGGECLHFMPEEEIAVYQQLEEQRLAAEMSGEPFDWQAAKQILAAQTTGNQQRH
ncbi:PA2817 family protein [Spartinivicinus ruber]|uniref:PA2817 family protein n=1 Tax=Spartinivicinus ruber TaxID=2683272 RepID=UPI0013D14B18|nr:PA2817 family protein [Spartinivicinus ruber]